MAANIGWATEDAAKPLTPISFDRDPIGPEDVRIAIAFCGVCHSDIHQARDEFGGGLATNYPCMPGHEITGTVSAVGERVQRYAVGDRVGVGCMVYWGSEEQRGAVDEQYQVPPPVYTYNTRHPDSGQVTFGGYSDEIVVNEHFVLRIPDSLPLEQAAPMLCAGVTTWSPLKHWNVGDGQVVAVAGIGGLGHMAIQLAKAVPVAGQARRSLRHRRHARAKPSWGCRLRNSLDSADQHRRLTDRQRRRDAGSTGLLRAARHHRRRRCHPR